MASFFGFGGASAELTIKLKDASGRQQIKSRGENGEMETRFLFTGNDTVAGTVTVSLKSKKVDHLGIKVEFVGQIEFNYDRANPYEFISLVRDLEPQGALEEGKTYTFEFANVDKSFESYYGNNVRLRYFLRAKILRQYAADISNTLDLAVQNVQTEPDTNPSIKMEVGIEDCFTPDHEVLTSNGFKAFASVSEDDLIASVVPKEDGDHIIQMEAPIRQRDGRVFLEKVLGDGKQLAAVKTPQQGGVALTTTVTHDWYAETKDATGEWSGSMEKTKIGDLVQQQKAFRLMGAVSGGFTPSTQARMEWDSLCTQLGLITVDHQRAFVELYGYWCGEGTLNYAADTLNDGTRLPYVQFKAVKDSAYIETLFARLGFASADFSVDENRFVIEKESWRRLFHSWNMGNSDHTKVDADVQHNEDVGADLSESVVHVLDEEERVTARVIRSAKVFFEWVFRCLTKDELRLIIRGYRIAYGGTQSNVIITSCPDVRDTLSHLLLLAGFSTKSRVTRDGPCWALSYSEVGTAETTNDTHPTVEPKDCAIVPAEAASKVYCVTVPSGLIIARKKVDNEVSQPVVVGNCLHIEFEYNKKNYHLSDVVIGKIYFLLVRIKIKYMEIVIIKRETCGSGQGPNTYNESTNISKFELMDGAPVRGESIPIRLFLSPYELTPTYKNIHNRFSVKYYLNLVLVDEEDRRYFKQQEINLWRKTLTPAKTSDMDDSKMALKDID